MKIAELQRRTCFVLIFLFAFLCSSCAEKINSPFLLNSPPTIVSIASNSNPNLFLGNASHASSSEESKDNYLLVKAFYTLSYNSSKGEPNWVSWRLTKDDIGTAPRAPKFATDETLPTGFVKIRHEDYTNSGFDRGHMCPKEDRSITTTMSYATFVMSNVIPQAPRLNEQRWAQLENYCRSLVKNEHQRLYIIDGPAGYGGEGKNGLREKIAGGRVVVPAYCWKVVVVVPDEGIDDLAEFNQDTRVIAVIMPNVNSAGEDWAPYRNHSVADIEQLTGFKFFDELPPQTARALEIKVDNIPITTSSTR
jgi:endonuclease G